MKTQTFDIADLLLLTPPIYEDSRGFFCERFKVSSMPELGIHRSFLQDNFSRSSHCVLRGLHFQTSPNQGKLVTCLRGKILDVAVDLRRHSPSFGQHVSLELSGDKPQWFWIPQGFAHGFLVLSEEGADVLYKVDAPYSPSGEGSILWSDPDLNIPWPLKNPLLSDKDAKAPPFKQLAPLSVGEGFSN